jgi:hypothetical protein
MSSGDFFEHMKIPAALLTLSLAPSLHAAALDEPTHVEVAPIKFDIGGDDGRLKTIAMDSAGNLLVGVSFLPAGARAGAVVEAPRPRGDVRANTNARGGLNPALSPPDGGHTFALKVISPEGRVLATWPMRDGLEPKMIHGCDDGAVYVAGGGKLAAFGADGTLIKMIDTDAVSGQRAVAAGLYVTATQVFLALGFGNSMRATEDVWRFDRQLGAPQKIIDRLFGCCSHIDLEVQGGEILIGENSRHRVNRYDLDGTQLGTWGRRDRTSLEGFTACCNPCNSDMGPGGVYFAAESGVGRVKKYATDGKFLGLVGYVDTTKFDGGSALAAQSCYIPIEVNRDASRIYVMDVRAHIIRVLAAKN